MSARVTASRRHLSEHSIRMWSISIGVLIAGAILLCCIAQQGGDDLPQRAEAIRDRALEDVTKPLSPLQHQERAEPVEKEVHAEPDRTETAARCARGIAVALRSGRTADKELVFKTSLPELFQLDSSSAIRLVERLETWAWREDAMKCVIREWAVLNPIEAANWASRLPDTSERKVAIEQLCLTVASHEPAQAVTIAEHFGGGNWNRVLLEQLASLWAAKDYGAAVNWVARQPQGELRNSAYARLAMVRAEVLPAEAANLVVDCIPPGQVQTEAAMSVLHQWILRDPTSAASWVDQFPEGDLRRRAEEEVAGADRYYGLKQ